MLLRKSSSTIEEDWSPKAKSTSLPRIQQYDTRADVEIFG